MNYTTPFFILSLLLFIFSAYGDTTISLCGDYTDSNTNYILGGSLDYNAGSTCLTFTGRNITLDGAGIINSLQKNSIQHKISEKNKDPHNVFPALKHSITCRFLNYM